jgi:symplekin
MDAMIREFALQMLRKLQLHSPAVDIRHTDGDVVMNGHGNGNVSLPEDSQEETAMSENPSDKQGENEEKEQHHDVTSGQQPQDDLVQTPYLPERIELPAQKQQVLQHVELLFALSVKVPDFLDQ